MRKLKQTRLHNPPEILGNCFPTVIACFLDLDSPENAIQIQENYSENSWNEQLDNWLNTKGWRREKIEGHLYNDSFYTVTGSTKRGTVHICIYKNGKLYHDPHPSNEGLTSEVLFETFTKFEKECFKCGKVKSMTEYYKHKQMGDGYLGKCKTCTVEDSKQTTELKTSTPEGLEKERARHRDKYHRLGYKEQQKIWNAGQPWKDSNVYKGLRKKYYKNLPREFELHHWNYNDYYLKDVFILNIKDHKNLHNHLHLDLEKRIFYLQDGAYLDTREKHEEYIKKLGIQIK
jgi:hypothetical protein